MRERATAALAAIETIRNTYGDEVVLIALDTIAGEIRHHLEQKYELDNDPDFSAFPDEDKQYHTNRLAALCDAVERMVQP